MVSVGLNRTRGLFWVVVETVTSVVRDPLTDANVEWEDASLVPLGSAAGLLGQIAGNQCQSKYLNQTILTMLTRVGQIPPITVNPIPGICGMGYGIYGTSGTSGTLGTFPYEFKVLIF